MKYHHRFIISNFLLFAVAAVLLTLPRYSTAQELQQLYFSEESPESYWSIYPAIQDILTARITGSQGAYLARRCPERDYGIGTPQQRLQYCVTPAQVPFDLSQAAPVLFGEFAPGYFPRVSCGICPLFDPFNNVICHAEQEKCHTEEALIEEIEQTMASTCSYSLDSDSGWSFYNTPPYSGLIPPDSAMYEINYLKSLEYKTWRRDAAGSCVLPVEGTEYWSLISTTFKTCPGGYPQAIPNGARTDGSCINDYEPVIFVGGNKEKSKGSCGTANPCFPTTGVKTLDEPDFASATLPLTRHYHSEIWEHDYAAMGRGWSHTYSERLLPVNSTLKRFLDATGNVEQFRCMDTPACTRFHSVNLAGSILNAIPTGWELLSPGGTRREFDQDGRLLSIEERAGSYRHVLISYTPDDKVDVVIDQSGRVLQFNYNSDGLVDSVTLPSGRQIQYRYHLPPSVPANASWSQQLVRVIREDQAERIYHYEDQNADGTPRYEFLVTGVTDENGARYSTFSYDYANRVTSSELANGAERVTLNYTKRPGESYHWTITELTRPLGEVETYEMRIDPFRKPFRISNLQGQYTISYGSGPGTLWPTRHTDRKGNETQREYADGLHVTSLTRAVGQAEEHTTETDWDNAINRVVERREPGKTTSYTYNARGQVLTRTETDAVSLNARRWTYTYHEAPSIPELLGRLESLDGPRTDVEDITSYDYYSNDDPGGAFLKGDLHKVTNALGHVTEFITYDGNGRPLQVRDANDVTTTLSYHARGWISGRSVDGQMTSFDYDLAGNLTRITQPDGSYTGYEYDDAHRLVAMADNFNNRIEYTMDAAGNPVAENTFNDAGELRKRLNRVYDQAGRLKKIIDGNLDETVFAYDENGNRSSSTDPTLNNTIYEYDPLDRLIRTIDARLGETLMSYDHQDRPLTVTDPLMNTTTYTYDGLGNMTQLDSPDSGITSYEFDALGNRISATDGRNVTVQYQYDALNRTSMIDYPDDSLDVMFSYDEGANGKGRLTSMQDAAGTETYTYDARGNLVAADRDTGGIRYSTQYQYNSAGRMVRITYPSGMEIDFTLDAAGRTVSIDKTVEGISETLVSGVLYEPFGPAKGFVFGNGLSMQAAYDLEYELNTLQTGGLDWGFAYDGSGNLLSITDHTQPTANQAFEYDPLHRLIGASGGYGTELYQYDASGNRTQLVGNGMTETYTYEFQSNRLASQNGWNFTRDASGNRTRKLDTSGFGQLYQHGDNNRLLEVSVRDGLGDSTVGTYVHDGRGQRVIKQAGSVTTHYVYGMNGELLGEYRDDGATKEYIFFNGLIVAIVESKTEWVQAPLETVVLDNGSAGTSSTGSWLSRNSAGQYGTDYLMAKKRAGNTYRWTPELTAGTHTVSAWWPPGKGLSSNVEYTIVHESGTDLVVTSQKTNGGQWSNLGVFEGLQYVEVNAANGKTVADAMRFSELAGPPVLQESRHTYFVHTDHLGAPRMVSNLDQTHVWQWAGTPFGGHAPDQDPDGDGETFALNLRFPGQYYDSESGLHYNYFRSYDPGTGRYIQSDPIGLMGGINVFAYGAANPTGFIDPSGLEIVGTWDSHPRIHDIAAGIPRWKEYDFGDPRLIAPGFRVGWFEVDVSARVSYRVKCQEFPETDTECLSDPPETWYLNSGEADEVSRTINIPYRFTVGPAWFKWGALAARTARSAEQKAKSLLVSLAMEIYQDPTLMCILGSRGN